MWAVAAQPRTGLTPMIPTPSVDSRILVGEPDDCGGQLLPPRAPRGSARAMRLDLDLEVDLLAHQEAARLDRHVPGHPPVLAIDRRLRRRGEHRLPIHVRPPPEALPREVDRP